jgi:hypothetical protein
MVCWLEANQPIAMNALGLHGKTCSPRIGMSNGKAMGN